MRARRTIAGNEVGRRGPPVYLTGHSRRRRRGRPRLIAGILALATLVLLILVGLDVVLTGPQDAPPLSPPSGA